MARQLILATFVVTLAVGCRRVEPYTGAFDLPVAVAVLQPEDGGPFLEPVGLVANQHGGQIVPLALKQGRFLTEDSTVPFLRGNPLPTGALRVLTSVAVTAPTVDAVTAWVGDRRFGHLLEVPWLLDCEAQADRDECAADRIPGAPVEPFAYRDVLSAPEGITLDDLRVKRGYTTSEVWTVTFDGELWWVDGSRSGPQPVAALTGQRWDPDPHALAFTIRDPEGRATAGDRFEIRTQSGLRELDVGGVPTALSAAPDQHTLAMVLDPGDGFPTLAWFDTDSRRVTPVALAPDAVPGRLAWTEDGALLVTDLERSAVWEVAPGATTGLEHVLPWPTLDVAELGGVLFVVPRDGRSLWRVDRVTDELFDTNAAVEGLQGIPFTSSVVGLDAVRLPYRMPEYSDTGIRRFDRSVAISLSSGALVFAHEDTGCLVQSPLGPRSVYDPNSVHLDYSTTFDEVVSGPTLEQSGSTTRHVVVNDCAGIAPAEQWTLRYDEVRQGWEVRGTYSGIQTELALEDQRYVSDGAEVSFVVRSGATPTRDGMTIAFSVDSGVAAAAASTSDVVIRQVAIGVSGDLSTAVWRAGLSGPIGDHEGEGWYVEDLRTVVIAPAAASNEVARVDPQTATVDVGWE